ncbi:MAG: signal recognition particle-docking protein FtsY [Ignavibacteriaceae bacterium]|jgi:signal recognition particle-docking protein FtsY|nr:MAG: Signal recognition particle GTPase protein [Chlorobi bacterium OLB4]MBW7855743.1 signal recognition particle-docking protein FtsY [Ignavibacteria bacterium]MEB2330524.1 signal recognition particle-docking protein FtsY [Ignavibacteriaceae bacterium]OQY76478.1 MAG: signal recognition particle-docking protein FtsY [Ignavibacteriales bacterium UTCHB1]
MSFFDKLKFNRLKEGLTKTKDDLFNKVNRLVNASSKIDDDFLEQLEAIFISADMGYETTDLLITNIKERAGRDKFFDQSELNTIITEEMKKILADNLSEFKSFDLNVTQKPFVIMIVGVNGVGKTTSIGKLAYNFRKAGKKVLIGSADTFRAAANDQLEVWAQRAEVEIIQRPDAKDPASVAYETVNIAIAKGYDVVLIDTAGRLHNKSHLMEELKKIKRVMQKVVPDAPHEIFIAIDATTGQNGLNQAKEFSNTMGGLTGIILTKLDGTAKGGIVMKIANDMKVPVRFIGVGEKIEDLQIFDKDSFIKALFEN